MVDEGVRAPERDTHSCTHGTHACAPFFFYHGRIEVDAIVLEGLTENCLRSPSDCFNRSRYATAVFRVGGRHVSGKRESNLFCTRPPTWLM